MSYKNNLNSIWEKQELKRKQDEEKGLKLKLKDFTSYGMGLKVTNGEKVLPFIGTQGRLILMNDNSDCVSSIYDETYWLPILYPLDLTKPIWFEGKEIIPFEEIFGFKYTKEVTIHYEFYKGILDDIWLSVEHGSDIDVDITFCFTEYLNMYKWRLDVNRLIPQKLAKSVHDVDPEIYKSK
jgi:hypothetical protein